MNLQDFIKLASMAGVSLPGGVTDANGITYTLPGDGTVQVTSGKKFGEFPSLFNFGAVGGDGSNVTKDTDAYLKAIDWAITNRSFVMIPQGMFGIAVPPDYITKPIGLVGVHPMLSILKLTPDFVGSAVPVQNCGFGDETTNFPINGNTAFANSANDLLAGATFRSFSVIGDRNSSLQQGLYMEGNVDHLTAKDLFFGYLNGRALWGGSNFGNVRGQVRESSFDNIRIRCCGRADSTASVSFYHNPSTDNPTADGSNLFTLDDIHVVFPYGRGMEFIDTNTGVPTTPMYGITGKRIMLHGRHVRDTRSNGPLLHIEGDVAQIALDVNFAFSDKGEFACRVQPNYTSGAMPSSVTINAMMGDVWQGINLQNGVNINWNVEQGSFVRREMMTVNGDLQGPVGVKCSDDACFVQTPADFTFNAKNPVVIPNLKNAIGVLTWFPLDAANGTGDTMTCDIDGSTGTLTRTGSSATDWTYTFTPDYANTAIVRAGTWISKFVIGSGLFSKMQGRFKYTPLDRYGVESSSIRVVSGGSLKFAVSPNSGNLNHMLTAQQDGNLIMSSFDKAGAQKTVYSIYAHFDGGNLSMNYGVPTVASS